MSEQVIVRWPNATHTGARAMPATFVASGTAGGKALKRIRAVLTGPGGTTVEGQVLRFAAAPGQYRYQWVVLFKNVPAGNQPQPHQLAVYGVTRTGAETPPATAAFDVGGGLPAAVPGAAPTVEYPPADYVISGDERDYFMPFGYSDIAVTAVTLGGKAADTLDWTFQDDFWWALFTGLATDPGPGNYDLVVTNGDGSTPVPVTIADYAATPGCSACGALAGSSV